MNIDVTQAELYEIREALNAWRERLQSNTDYMALTALNIRAGETVPLWAPGERGAKAAEEASYGFAHRLAVTESLLAGLPDPYDNPDFDMPKKNGKP